jgi:hypothetical protein
LGRAYRSISLTVNELEVVDLLLSVMLFQDLKIFFLKIAYGSTVGIGDDYVHRDEARITLESCFGLRRHRRYGRILLWRRNLSGFSGAYGEEKDRNCEELDRAHNTITKLARLLPCELRAVFYMNWIINKQEDKSSK